MSYVLDALEKSERERQQNHPPNLLSVHATEPSFGDNHRGTVRYLIYGTLSLILLLLFGGIFAFSFFKRQETTVQDQTVSEVTPPKSQIIINPEVATVISKKQFYNDTEDKVVYLAPEKKKISFSIPVEAPPGNEQPEPASETIPLQKDLPPELQKQIPILHFSGHTFSRDPQRRMIIVNNKILREGDSIDSITALKEITWDGAVIDFGGLLFRVDNQ